MAQSEVFGLTIFRLQVAGFDLPQSYVRLNMAVSTLDPCKNSLFEAHSLTTNWQHNANTRNLKWKAILVSSLGIAGPVLFFQKEDVQSCYIPDDFQYE